MEKSEPPTAVHRIHAAWMAALLIAGALLPLWPALRAGHVAGGGPDVVSTLWGMWWFQQEGAVGAIGQSTTLANFPFGATGIVLSPATATLWAGLAPVLGQAVASTAVIALTVLLLVAATYWLARGVGLGSIGSVWAAASMLVGRYLLFGAGEGSVVAISNLPLPIGLLALTKCKQGDHLTGWSLLLSLATIAMAFENPYLAPVLPALALGTAAHDSWRNKRLTKPAGWTLTACLVGCLGVLAAASLFSAAANPMYPREVAGTPLTLGPMSFTVVDLPWARVSPLEVVYGGPVQWTVDAASGVSAAGGRTLGVTVMGLALWAAARRSSARIWLGLAAASFILSLGSQVGSIGAPFLYLNTVLTWFARPLTQPVRFLAVTHLALCIAAGFGAQELLKRWGSRFLLGLGAVMFAETIWVGGGSLRLPTTAIPDAPCAQELSEGGVVVWPWDARDGDPSQSQLLQLRHGQPAVHPGIASWRINQPSATERIRAMGISLRPSTAARLQLGVLDQHGYRWVILDETAAPTDRPFLTEQLGEPVQECSGYTVFDIKLPEHAEDP